jgi:hypothetical protein
MVGTPENKVKQELSPGGEFAVAGVGVTGPDRLHAALSYLKRGWSALALCPPDHQGVSDWHNDNCKGNSLGKTPCGKYFQKWLPYKDQLPHEKTLSLAWAENPHYNVGVAMGPVSGLFSLDIDGDEGEAALDAWEQANAPLPPTLEFNTAKGRRLLFRWPAESIPNEQIELGGGEVRVLSKGRQTAMPPSVHYTGFVYEWRQGRGPGEIEAAEAPAWLIKLVLDARAKKAPPPAPPAPPATALAEVAERARKYLKKMGECHPEAEHPMDASTHLLKAANALAIGFALDDATSVSLLAEWDVLNAVKPYPVKELERKVREAREHPHWPKGAPQVFGYLLAKDGPTPPSGNGKAHAPGAGCAAQPKWEPPVPLSVPPAAGPFPLEVLPTSLKDLVLLAADALNCPPDYVAVPSLVLAGSAAGASRAVRIKPGYTERPALFAVVVGPPGRGKTPALNLVCAPVYDEEAKRRKEHATAVANCGEDDDKPTLESLYVSDVTTERVASKLADSPRGLALIRDELSGWVDSMDQYKPGGKGHDRQFYLSAWSGHSIVVDRANAKHEPLSIRHPFLAVVGGIQPDLFYKLRGERRAADGFLDRLLFAFPTPTPDAGENWSDVPDKALETWKNALAKLWGLEMVSEDSGVLRPFCVSLTAEGRTGWKAFTDDLAKEVNGADFPECLQGPWAKLKGYGARLALVVQLLRWAYGETADQDVNGESMARAAKLVDYFKSNARKAYAVMEADPGTADANRVLRCLAKHPKLERFVRSELYRNHLRGTFKRPEALDDPLRLLEVHGYLRGTLPYGPDHRGAKPIVYEVNPLWNRSQITPITQI